MLNSKLTKGVKRDPSLPKGRQADDLSEKEIKSWINSFNKISEINTLSVDEKIKNIICTRTEYGNSLVDLIPLSFFIEQPWTYNPSVQSTVSVIYLGLVSTGIAWLLRFKILVDNGLIFQSQVSYLIPIFGTILSYIFLKELITVKVLISLIAVVIGIYFVRRAGDKKVI